MKDGGPAFPCDWKDFSQCTGEQVAREQFFGITMRDYFAAKAMQAMLGQREITADESPEVSKMLAMDAYAIADAMLKERNIP